MTGFLFLGCIAVPIFYMTISHDAEEAVTDLPTKA